MEMHVMYIYCSVQGYMSDSLPDVQMSGSNTNISKMFTSPTTSIKAPTNMVKSSYSKVSCHTYMNVHALYLIN